MLQPRIAAPLWRTLLDTPTICICCQQRALRPLALHTRTFTSAPTLRLPAPSPKETNVKPKPAPEAKDEEVFVPKPLGRPIGFRDPPKAGENAADKKVKKDYSGMTMSQRNLEKRKDLVEKWGTNYFRDFKNIRKYRSGKTFMANPKIFKKEAALFFPNFHGETLAESKADTTPTLQGKVSVVNVYSSQWGEGQVQTFTSKEVNPELHELLRHNWDVAQQVDINIEENSMKAWIIALFQWRLRRQRPQEDWGKYFVIRRGVSERIRETIGLLNGRVGYVYLVDQDCKIRWAGSGNAEGTETEDLTKGFKRMIEEARLGPRANRVKIPPQTKGVEEKDEQGMPIPVPVAFK